MVLVLIIELLGMYMYKISIVTNHSPNPENSIYIAKLFSMYILRTKLFYPHSFFFSLSLAQNCISLQNDILGKKFSARNRNSVGASSALSLP